MRRLPPLLALLLAGCAAPAAGPVPPEIADPVPPLLVQLPENVRVQRAVMELASGDAEQERHARAVLRAIPSGPALDPLTALWQRSPATSEARLAALGALIECGAVPDEAGVDERVAALVRDIDRDTAGAYTTVMGVLRLRDLGAPAGEALDRLAGGSGPRAAIARRLHDALFDPARGSQVRRP